MAPSLHVVVEELSKDADVCGIRGASIESAAVRTLREHGIHVVASLEKPYSYLYIAANVLSERSAGESPPRCVVDTRVEVVGVSPTQAAVGGFKGPRSRRDATESILCSSAGTSRGYAPSVERHFTGDLEQRIKLCLGSLT